MGMMRNRIGVRRLVAGTLAGLLALLTAAMYLPMPVYGLWLVRFIARELALDVALLGVLAALLLRSPAWRSFALATALLASLPVQAALPALWRSGAHFSLRQYLTLNATAARQSEVTERSDVVLTPSRPDLKVDIYEGAGATLSPRPFALVIHGGSWIHGDKGDARQISRALASAGISVFDVRYRLSPEHRFPASVKDVKCVLGQLRAQSQKYRIDPRQAALIGRSAGGQLALLAAYSAGDGRLTPACEVPDEPVQAVVAIYPFTELLGAYAEPPTPDPEETRSVMEAHFGGTAAAQSAAYQLASPKTHILPVAARQLPPTLFLHGSSDMLVPSWHSAQLLAALQAAGQRATLVQIPLAEHAFDFRPGGVGEQLERSLVPGYLTQTLSSAPSNPLQ